jgi:DHA1 family bicyclomycin/chloramphenicol resistance-like MFS transporter
MAFVILLFVRFALPESRQADTSHSLKPKAIVKNYLAVLKEPQFYTYAFTGAVAAAGLYAYVAGSPIIFLEIFKTTEKQFGLIFAMIAAGLILATQVNSFLLRRFSSQQIIPVALFIQSLAGIGLFIGSWQGWLQLNSTIALLIVYLSCQGFTFPNSSALSMAPFSRNAGSASALMGGVQMGIGALTSALVSMLSNGTAMPMTGVMATCAVGSFCILQVGSRIIRYKASRRAVEEESVDMVSSS